MLILSYSIQIYFKVALYMLILYFGMKVYQRKIHCLLSFQLFRTLYLFLCIFISKLKNLLTFYYLPQLLCLPQLKSPLTYKHLKVCNSHLFCFVVIYVRHLHLIFSIQSSENRLTNNIQLISWEVTKIIYAYMSIWSNVSRLSCQARSNAT